MSENPISRERRLRDDDVFSWVELREAGAIDPDAPWPFGDIYPGGLVVGITIKETTND